MVSESLVKAAEEVGGALVEWSDVQWESDGCEDIQPSFPIIKVVQRMSGMEGASKHVGEFWHSDREGDAAYEPDIEVVGLVKRDTRALFAEGSDKPLCMSADGRAPLANQMLWEQDGVQLRDGWHEIRLKVQPEFCDMCPFAQWGANNEPPPCRESKVVLVERTDDGSLAQLRISGMSIKPFENFVAKQLRPRGLPLYSKKLVLTTAERKRDGKTWEEIEVHPTQLSIAEAQEYAARLRAERQRFEKSVQEGGVEWQEEGSLPDAPFE
jgi:hypothetical protein